MKFLGRVFVIVVGLLMLIGPVYAASGNGQSCIPVPNDTIMSGDTIYFSISSMDFDRYRTIFLGYEKFNWKKAVIDLNSFGGSHFDAMGMVSLIAEQQSKGKIIEIRGRGLVASAGLIILLSGSPGHRFLDKHSMLMFHEMWSLKFFAVETASDKEEEAAIFRKIQDKSNSWIIARSKISKEELNAKIKKKEFWMDADEALKYGFADKLF